MKSGVVPDPLRRAIVPALLVLLAACLVAVPTTASGANAKKLPLLYKGNGYKLKPGLIYGWDPDGFGKPLRYLGKTHASDPAGTSVRWSRWGRNRAVGVGRASSTGCDSGKCEVGYPWNGTLVRVVAWRPQSGHFTRMKVNTRVPKSSKRYYELVLAFRGPYVPDRTVSWKVQRETKRGKDTADAKPAKLSDGNSSQVKPNSLTGWSVLGVRGTVIKSIRWKTWGREGKAIGVGRTADPVCDGLPCGRADALDLSVWDNRRIRVTAFRARNGEYRRLRVFQWTAWNHKNLQENYHFTLAYQGAKKALPWRTIELDRGIR